MGFGVAHCCYYDKIYLQLMDMGALGLQRAIETDIRSPTALRLLPGEYRRLVLFLDYEDSHHHGPLLCSFQLL